MTTMRLGRIDLLESSDSCAADFIGPFFLSPVRRKPVSTNTWDIDLAAQPRISARREHSGQSVVRDP